MANESFETAGASQGLADGWTTTTTGDAQIFAAIEAGDGLLYAWESFSGWVAGQSEYRAAFDGGDTTAGPLETFAAWATGQSEYRAAFEASDTSGGVTEPFDAWVTGQAGYRAAFEPGDTTAGDLETFALWVASQADYSAGFGPGDTSAATFQLGMVDTGPAETFGGSIADVAVQTTASSSVIAAAGHSFAISNPVQLIADGALPTPFQKGITYWVVTPSAGVSVGLATSEGGPAITATSTGEATLIGDPAYYWRNPRTSW